MKKKTKEITAVMEVWICDPNYRKVMQLWEVKLISFSHDVTSFGQKALPCHLSFCPAQRYLAAYKGKQ